MVRDMQHSRRQTVQRYAAAVYAQEKMRKKKKKKRTARGASPRRTRRSSAEVVAQQSAICDAGTGALASVEPGSSGETVDAPCERDDKDICYRRAR
jgi:hypothetical protein